VALLPDARMKALARRSLPDPIWAALKRVRHTVATRKFRRRVVTHQFWRWPLSVSIEDPTGAAWYDHDWPETPESLMLARHRLRPGACVFDLGAHQGVVALMLAKEVGVEGRVIAVEADRANAAIAVRNTELNAMPNVTVLHAAVNDRAGSVRFDRLEAHLAASEGSGDIVSGITIDDLTARFGRPDLVYVDIEGYEQQALKGAASTLAGGPDWYIEVHSPEYLRRFESTSHELVSTLSECGYDLWLWDGVSGEFAAFKHAAVLPADRFFIFATKASARQPHSPRDVGGQVQGAGSVRNRTPDTKRAADGTSRRRLINKQRRDRNPD
jgi:FkbM family methyltransferase